MEEEPDAKRPELFFNYYPFDEPITQSEERLRACVTIIKYENFLIERKRLLNGTRERQIKQITVEANFFNNQSKIWTVLRGN